MTSAMYGGSRLHIRATSADARGRVTPFGRRARSRRCAIAVPAAGARAGLRLVWHLHAGGCPKALLPPSRGGGRGRGAARARRAHDRRALTRALHALARSSSAAAAVTPGSSATRPCCPKVHAREALSRLGDVEEREAGAAAQTLATTLTHDAHTVTQSLCASCCITNSPLL